MSIGYEPVLRYYYTGNGNGSAYLSLIHIYIGSSIVLADILELRTIVVPAFILIIGYSINCFLTGKILSKHYDFTQREAMLAATPAGASDMALISSDIGVHLSLIHI